MAISNRLTDIDIDQAALADLINGEIGQRALQVAADGVRDRARRNAAPISQRLADAIWSDDPKRDAEGAYIDVGYDKNQPGWVLWWHEVGTALYPARPHLRPALTQG